VKASHGGMGQTEDGGDGGPEKGSAAPVAGSTSIRKLGKSLWRLRQGRRRLEMSCSHGGAHAA
jgi:hypothetical protein